MNVATAKGNQFTKQDIMTGVFEVYGQDADTRNKVLEAVGSMEFDALLVEQGFMVDGQKVSK